MKKTFSILTITLILLGFSSTSFARKKVVLDNYYNNETHKKTGLPYHYLWEDKALSGFSELGDLFVARGAKLATLADKPDKSNLRCADIYIIVDPDTPAETSKPNYMDMKAASDIANWVKKGGILLMFTNDAPNCELDSFNILASKFGMQYNKVLLHPELKAEPGKPRNYDSCAFTVIPDHPIFKGVKKPFMKETSSITCQFPAEPVLVENGDVFIAQAKYGKGFVLAIADPWLYNEYINHAHLPTDFDNLTAAKNLVEWLMNKK